MIRAHLSTEQLLLQCDGRLSSGPAAHLDVCERCSCALVELTAVLHQAELELRASVPEETSESHRASWAALESRLQTIEVAGGEVKPFPLRWATLYAAAAALGFVVIGGYLSLEFFGAPMQAPEEIAGIVEPAAAPVEAQPVVQEPGRTGEGAAIEAPTPAPNQPRTEPVQPAVVEPTSQEPLPVPTRFELAEPRGVIQRPASVVAAEFSAPALELGSRSSVVLASVLSMTSASAEPAVYEPVRSQRRQGLANLSPTAAEAVINGHWMLYEGDVWREDIIPVWTAAGLVLRGTVENEAARERVLAAIGRTKGGSDVAVELQPRDVKSGTSTASLSSTRMEQYPLGGAVRNSLLTHFGDTARRSFVASEPSVLQGEIDHFVNEVFQSQSELLSHAYALKNVLGPVDREQMRALGLDARAKVQKLARFHLNAVNGAQARIYDRLSETLPRKFWSYRASKSSLAPKPDWRSEVATLLGDTLELDSTLTALLSTPESTVDASDSNLSCGFLLSRIRGRVRHLRAGTDSLR